MWFAYNGLTFSLINPVFFLNRLDVTHNFFMLSDLQHLIINHLWLQICLDVMFLILPAALLFSVYKNKRLQPLLAIITALFNILYTSFFSTMSFVSIENFTAWMFVPLIFVARSPKGFYYLLHVCRLIFITVFFSAALWKIRAGGIFNFEEMSAILFRQHASYLALNNNSWYSNFIIFLINHQAVSFTLYVCAFFAELIFVIGYFTTKWDKYMILSFCLFALFDYLLMGINYFTWLPFMGCFYFSKYRISDR